MDNDDAQIGTIITRREAMRLAARAGLGLAATAGLQRAGAASPGAPPKVNLVASPELTEGPFFVDEKLNRSDLIAGSTRPSVKNGIPLQVTFTIYKLSGSDHSPLKGAHVDVWHADAAGVYSDESNPMNHEDTSKQTWLRGYQLTDSSGTATFNTIFPGWYPGRCPHVHFKIRIYSGKEKVTADFTSQVFFKDADARSIYVVSPYSGHGHDTTNERDGVYNVRQVDGTMAGDHMLLDLTRASTGTGYTTNFTVVLTDQNLRAGRRGGGPGGPGGPPPGGPGGPPRGGPF